MGIYQLGNCNTLISIYGSVAGGVAGLFSAACRERGGGAEREGERGGRRAWREGDKRRRPERERDNSRGQEERRIREGGQKESEKEEKVRKRGG